MYTVAEIAKQRNVTERAIYKQIKNHSEELEGHIQKIGGKQWLDDYACKLLEEASGSSAPVIVEEIQEQEVEELKKEIARLQAEREEDQRALREMALSMSKILEQYNEGMKLVSESQLYIEQRDNVKRELERVQKECEDKDQELARYQRTVFGLYKKK